MAWLDDETLLFQANDSLDDLQFHGNKALYLLVSKSKFKKLTKVSPTEGVFNSPKPSSEGKIAFLGHPSKDYSYVAFDVYVNDG